MPVPFFYPMDRRSIFAERHLEERWPALEKRLIRDPETFRDLPGGQAIPEARGVQQQAQQAVSDHIIQGVSVSCHDSLLENIVSCCGNNSGNVSQEPDDVDLARHRTRDARGVAWRD